MAGAQGTAKKPFIDHMRELRTRLVLCALAILAGGGVGYAVHERLLELIQRPLGQTLYYTSPTGGFSFIFKLSVTFGLIVAVPVVIYHFIRFVDPLLERLSKLAILKYVLWSIGLAYAGIAFAYFVSLPAALGFLTRFGGPGIESLITADEYFNFALAYIGGFAVLFQLPLVVLFINRIGPLRPSRMMKAQKFIIPGSFIVAAILTPTPDPFNQLIMALPIILLYQISVGLVWLTNRRRARRVAPASREEVSEVIEAEAPMEPRYFRLASFAIDAARRPTIIHQHRPGRLIDIVVT